VPRRCARPRPIAHQARKVEVKRAFAGAEHVGSLPTQDPSDKPTTVTRPAQVLLDCGPVLGQVEDGRVLLLPAQIALVLDPLGCRRQAGGRPDRGPNLTHRLAHRVEKSATGVFHQVPAIGHMCRLGEHPGGGQGISAATVTSDRFDLRLG
jgi:hypothetical protein